VNKVEIWKQVMARLTSPSLTIANGDIVIKYGNEQINSFGEIDLLKFLDLFI
jgi:hypothetical protein